MSGIIHLYLDGIPGESTAKNFENWISISSFSVGNAMEIDDDARTGSGFGTSGSADGEDFSFTAKMDISTPVLLQCCALGAVIPRGRVVQCNIVGQDVLPVSDYAIGDSIITKVSVDASGGDIPDLNFEINYGSIIWQYHCYNHYNPSQKVGSSFRGWSLLSSNPEDADPNAQSAFRSIQPLRPGGYNFHGPGSVKFKAGPVLTMPSS